MKYIISPEQCKMARVSLGLNQKELAKKISMGDGTIARFELDTKDRKFNNSTLLTIKNFFESQGIKFIENENEIGVTIQKK